MKPQSLSHTNEYLRDPEKRRQALLRSVLSSSAVEGIKLTVEELTQLQHKIVISAPHSSSAQ